MIRYGYVAALGFALVALGAWYALAPAWIAGAVLVVAAYWQATDLRPPESRKRRPGYLPLSSAADVRRRRPPDRARVERIKRDVGCDR